MLYWIMVDAVNPVVIEHSSLVHETPFRDGVVIVACVTFDGIEVKFDA